MKSYCDLIQSGVLNFNNVLLNVYKKIGLDEVDCIILLKLQENIARGNKSLDINYLSKTMTLNSDLLSERIVKLVNEDILTLELLDMKGPEILSLEPLYKKIGYVLENKEVKKEKKQTSNEVKKVAETIEKELNRILSPVDLQIIHKWFYEYKYSKEDINNEILNAKKYKNRGINYIDRCLYKKYNKTEEESEVDTMELFSKVYVKR